MECDGAGLSKIFSGNCESGYKPSVDKTKCVPDEYCQDGFFGNYSDNDCHECTGLDNAKEVTCSDATDSIVKTCNANAWNNGTACVLILDAACSADKFLNKSGVCEGCKPVTNASSVSCTPDGSGGQNKSIAVCFAGLVRTNSTSTTEDTCEEKCGEGYKYADIFDEQCYKCDKIENQAPGVAIVCQERRGETRFKSSGTNCKDDYQEQLYGIDGDICVKKNWCGAGHYPNSNGNCSTCVSVANTKEGTAVTCSDNTDSRIDASAFTSDTNFATNYPTITNKQDAINAYKAQQCRSHTGGAPQGTNVAIFYGNGTGDVCVKVGGSLGTSFNDVSTAYKCPVGFVLNLAHPPKSTSVASKVDAVAYTCVACPLPGTDSEDFHRARCDQCTKPTLYDSSAGFLFKVPICTAENVGVFCDDGFDFDKAETGCPFRYGARRLLRGKK